MGTYDCGCSFPTIEAFLLHIWLSNSEEMMQYNTLFGDQELTRAQVFSAVSNTFLGSSHRTAAKSR